METIRRHSSLNLGELDSPLAIALLVCLVAALSYLAPSLQWALMLHPQTVWPFWPSCALLVVVLVLVPRRIWPILIPISFASIVLFDLQKGVPIGSISWFIAADTIEVLIAALCLSYFFDGIPRLNSVKAVAKYLLFTVVLAPSIAAFLAAPGITPSISGDYWFGWRISFFSEVLAFLTLTPAILSWVSGGRAWLRRSLAYHLEAVALFATLVVFACVIFVPTSHKYSTALLYSLVPCLLWSALRFGTIGVSTSMITVMLIAIWGTVHGRGPFAEPGPFDQVLSLQFFLFFTATPFMVLAALVEERKLADAELKESEERLRLAAQAGRMYAYDWNARTNEVVRSSECVEVLGLTKPDPLSDEQFVEGIHPDDRERFLAEIAALTPEKPNRHITYRFLSPTGRVIWLRSSGHALFDEAGKLQKVVGMVSDVTELKLTEGKLREYEKAVEGAEDMIAVVDRQYRFLLANRQYLKMRNITREQVVGRSISDVLGTEIFETILKPNLDECFRGKVVRYEAKFSYPSVGKRDLLLSYFPIEAVNGTIDRAACILHDITNRKQAEEALSTMSRRLIEAQENERAWIARELHDDFSQRIAVVSVNLESLEGFSGSEAEAKSCTKEIKEQVRELGSDIHALSHRLHSSKLDYLGLAAACQGFCTELSARQNVEIEFHSENIPKGLSKEISLCLFRVLQEALQNAVKYSGVRSFQASVKSTSEDIQLTVSDSGSGFDPDEAISGRGLGLTSMKERLKLVDGLLSIESKPGQGTTIHARVPLSPETEVARTSS